MKKRIALSAIVVAVSVAGIIVLTTKEAGRIPEIPGYGYHDVEESDIFESGYVDGELSSAPLNSDFMEFGELPEDPVVARKTIQSKKGYSLGLIPSPIQPEVHKRTLRRTSETISDLDRFDLRNPDGDGATSDSLLPPPRNQGDCGACWAFATYGATEGTLLGDFGFQTDLSEQNVLFSTGYDWGECGGGNVDMSMAYLSRNAGPVSEQDDPFNQSSDNYCRECAPVRYIDSAIKLPVRSGVNDTDYIKEALMEFGPLYASMHWADAAFDSESNTYYFSGYSTNHAVTIVGWDDDKEVEGAPGDGCFIARNSWGTHWGEQGYFYVSYYDRSFAFSSLVAFSDEPDALLTFDRIYYHDKLGMTSSTGYGNTPAWGANLFTAVENGQIAAVSMFTTASDTSYEIRIYDRFNGMVFTDLSGGPYSGTLQGKGYHTIPLDEVVDVSAGDEFAVVVKFFTPGHRWPVPLEKPFPGYSSAATAGSGESFISPNGSDWTDVTDIYSNTNVCIKALVNEQICETDETEVEGPGDSNTYAVSTKEGSYVKAVVTDGCGSPVVDADVVAQVSDTESEIILYDDGLHDDRNADDGLYANSLARTAGGGLPDVTVTVRKGGVDVAGAEEIPAEVQAGAESSGCFILSVEVF